MTLDLRPSIDTLGENGLRGDGPVTSGTIFSMYETLYIFNRVTVVLCENPLSYTFMIYCFAVSMCSSNTGFIFIVQV